MNPRVLLLLAVLAAPGCSTFRVNRAALAPHAAPVMHSGQPLDGRAELGLGASSLSSLQSPSVGNPDAAVEIPGTQLHGDLRLRLSDLAAIGLVYEHGLDQTARRPNGDQQPPVDGGDVKGGGIAAELSLPTRHPRLRIGLHVDVMLWRVPYVEWRTCVELCGGTPFTEVERGFDSTQTLGLAVTPSYRSGPVVWFGGLTARQHPTIQQKATEGVEVFDGDPAVQSGPFNLILHGGVEAELARGVRASMLVYQSFSQDPVRYGPSVAAMITIPLGQRVGVAPPPRVVD